MHHSCQSVFNENHDMEQSTSNKCKTPHDVVSDCISVLLSLLEVVALLLIINRLMIVIILMGMELRLKIVEILVAMYFVKVILDKFVYQNITYF